MFSIVCVFAVLRSVCLCSCVSSNAQLRSHVAVPCFWWQLLVIFFRKASSAGGACVGGATRTPKGYTFLNCLQQGAGALPGGLVPKKTPPRRRVNVPAVVHMDHTEPWM